MGTAAVSRNRQRLLVELIAAARFRQQPRLPERTSCLDATDPWQFFALRAYRLWGRNRLLGVFLALAVLAVFGLDMHNAIACIRDALHGVPYVADVQKYFDVAQGYLYASAGVDLFICGAIIVKLWQGRKGVGATADALLVRICQLTLATSSLTAFAACVIAVCYIVKTTNTLYWSQIPADVLGQLFAISTLFSINNKSILREHWNATRSCHFTSFFDRNPIPENNVQPTRVTLQATGSDSEVRLTSCAADRRRVRATRKSVSSPPPFDCRIDICTLPVHLTLLAASQSRFASQFSRLRLQLPCRNALVTFDPIRRA